MAPERTTNRSETSANNQKNRQRPKQGRAKKKKTRGLTPEILSRRVMQLANEAEPQKPLTLAKEPAGTLEQIGHEADSAWRGVKKIMALLNTELKHVYYNAVNTQVTQAGSVLDLTSLISQGVGGSQRIGDSLKVKAVKIRLAYLWNSSMSSIGAGTFVLGMSRDGVPAVADVFAVVSNNASAYAHPTDTYDKVDHWVRTHFLVVHQYEPSKVFELNHTFNHDVLYTNAGTTATSGCVWLAFISNEATNFPSVSMGVDIAFLDN